VSIGDYILTGGEVAALTICDSIIRLLDGAITNESLDVESFDDDLLEYPQYTFPRDYNGDVVPDVLLCGNHKVVEKWRKKEQLKLTKKYRPDLFSKHNFTKEELKLLQEIEEGNESPKWLEDALEKGKKFLDKK
jgi:tRNA (guanine37-N1)-methyltransferase